ncbi:MAG: hypothetical protein KAI66_20910, partial [Lentisphaeria bacterium]|nr:hypothetical protein [Lentisphaeria bacterium]
MQAQLAAPNDSAFQFDMSLESFLASGGMSVSAKARFCSPEDLVLDHIPVDLDWEDDDELGAAFAQACQVASDDAVTHVSIANQDLRYIRGHLLPTLRLWPAGCGTGPM